MLPTFVIFDMDGVIFDTEHVAIRVWADAAAEFGVHDIESVYPRCIGGNAAHSMQILRDAYGPDFPFEAFQARTRAIYLQRYEQNGLPLKPGATEILQRLRERDIPMAIASSTRIETVTRELRDAKLYDFFDAVIGGDMVSRSKPAPDIFFAASERLSAPPEQCFVIEDSFNGIRAAHAAGMRPIMVPDMLEPTEEILQLAEYVFPSLSEVLTFFQTE